MARSLFGFLVLILALSLCAAASVFQPIADSHRSAALEIFSPVDGSFGSLEEAYEASRTFEVLQIEKKPDVSSATCQSVSKTLESSSSTKKDLFYALKVNGILKCKSNGGILEGLVSQLHASLKDSNSLFDFHYSVGSLSLIKAQMYGNDLHLDEAERIFRSIMALRQSDGSWRRGSDDAEPSIFAAGIAFQTLAEVVSLASAEIDQSLMGTLKNDMLKLFDGIENYDDGALYFNGVESQGPILTTASVVKGLSAFAALKYGSLMLPSDRMLGLAKFFLGIGVPGDAKDFFYQVDALACLEDNRISIPLILSPPSTVISLTKKNPLKVRVSTVLGANAPPTTVKLAKVFSSSSKDTSIIESQELKYNPDSGVHFLSSLPKSIDVGNYDFMFEVALHDSELGKAYTTGSQIKVPISVTGVIEVANAEIAVLDSDLGSVDTQRKLVLSKDNDVSLSANHLQKLRVTFRLTTPYGHHFKPAQAFLKLKHETNLEHLFLVGSSGKKFELVLDFLGLVEKLYYLSGKYDIQLNVGDAAMENSLSSNIGHIELDLPEPPEKAPRPPVQPVDPYLRYAPKPEITHIFRAPEKRPPEELSLAFLGLTVLPLLVFLIGLVRLGVNLKNFPSSAGAATYAVLFHGGIGAVLLLYALFWVKLDLFTTLKALGFLGVFLLFVGHRILSHLAATSNKLKSA